MGAVVELLGLLVVVGAAVGLVRSLRRVDAAATGTVPREPALRWAPHVGAVDNHTVVTVRRGAESLEIARFPADDPDWHDKLVTARAEAAVRATELNAPD